MQLLVVEVEVHLVLAQAPWGWADWGGLLLCHQHRALFRLVVEGSLRHPPLLLLQAQLHLQRLWHFSQVTLFSRRPLLPLCLFVSAAGHSSYLALRRRCYLLFWARILLLHHPFLLLPQASYLLRLGSTPFLRLFQISLLSLSMLLALKALRYLAKAAAQLFHRFLNQRFVLAALRYLVPVALAFLWILRLRWSLIRHFVLAANSTLNKSLQFFRWDSIGILWKVLFSSLVAIKRKQRMLCCPVASLILLHLPHNADIELFPCFVTLATRPHPAVFSRLLGDARLCQRHGHAQQLVHRRQAGIHSRFSRC
jgi:hypothetical protein